MTGSLKAVRVAGCCPEWKWKGGGVLTMKWPRITKQITECVWNWLQSTNEVRGLSVYVCYLTGKSLHKIIYCHSFALCFCQVEKRVARRPLTCSGLKKMASSTSETFTRLRKCAVLLFMSNLTDTDTKNQYNLYVNVGRLKLSCKL